MKIKLVELSDSSGYLSKAIYNINGELYLIKGSSPESYEACVEVLVSKLIDLIGFEHIQYRLFDAKYFKALSLRGVAYKYVSACKIYNDINAVEKISLYNYLLNNKSIKSGRIDTNSLDKAFLDLPNNLKYEISRMLWVDAIVSNKDRHLNNIELFIYNNKTMKMFPMFDFGASLWYDCSSRDKYNREKSKPFRSIHKNQVKFISKYFKYTISDINKLYINWIKACDKELKTLPIIIRNNILNGLYKNLEVYRSI